MDIRKVRARRLVLIAPRRRQCNMSKQPFISVKDLSVGYNSRRGETIEVLRNVSLDISRGESIGLVGESGSGKSTLINLMLGLLKPGSGNVYINKKNLEKLNQSWLKIISYVPQNIFLIDDTVAANIAFGIEKKNINLEAVKRAAKIANLDEFVNNELPNKYHTTIGERGIRLSGGQRQRRS